MSRMTKCPKCGAYTLSAGCPACGARTVQPGPAKWSPEDTYGEYRRRLKRMERSGMEASA